MLFLFRSTALSVLFTILVFRVGNAQIGGVAIQLEGGLGTFVLDNYGTNNSKLATLISNGFKLGVAYKFFPRMDIGICVFRNGFLVEKDSKYLGENGGVGVYANGDLYRSSYSVLYGTVGAGYSGLVFENYNKLGKAFSNGYYLSAGIGRRLDFATVFSFFYQTKLSYYRYFNLENRPDNQPIQYDNSWRLNVIGLEIKVGVIFRIGVPLKSSE